MIDLQMLEDITATCNLLGYLDENGKYNKTPECENCLRDLIRFLRKDSSHFVFLRKLGHINLIETDLIPIMKQYCANNERFFDIVIRLLVMLTNPALVLFKEKVPQTIEEKQIYLQINEYLFDYKLILSRDLKFWSTVGKRMALILDKDWSERLEEHRILLERILILIRNIINVPIDTFLNQKSLDSNVQDNLIEVVKESGILDLIIYMCQNSDEYEFCFHLLEILSSLLREQSGEFLAKSVEIDLISANYNRRNNYEVQLDQEELKEILNSEKRAKIKSQHTYNRFKESTYVVKNLKSLSDQDLIYHKTPEDVTKITLDTNKAATRRTKRRQLLEEDSVYSSKGQPLHRSALKIRNLLKNFCSSFISSCYNSFMKCVRANLERKLAQENDETYFLWACQFFMEFNRCSNADPNFINETFSLEIFHYFHTLIEHHLEMFVQEKKDFRVWSKRLHYAVKAYRELLFTLNYISSSKNSELQSKAKDILSKIFYETEYRELFLELVSGFNESKMSFSYLKDLIETNHIFLKMLESFMKKNKRFLVPKKVHKKAAKKSTGIKKTYDLVEVIWTEISSDLSLAINGETELPLAEDHIDLNPIDTLSEKTLEEQKVDVMSRVHKFLLDKQPLKAVALFRNARDVWSDDPEKPFGSSDISLEEELLSLREIILSDLWPDILPKDSEKIEDDDSDQNFDSQPFENECKVNEQLFELNTLIYKYAHCKIIKTYSLLFKNFRTNSESLNHAIIKLFHRIAWDCKMPAVFFQLSLFKIFQDSFEILPVDASQSILEIQRFSEYIVRKFIQLAQKNHKVLIEIVFWKNKKELHEIEEEYGSS